MIDHNQASDLIRTEVARIVTEGGLVNPDQGETVQRAAIKALQWAWCQAVRAEWQAFVDADPELKAQHAIALELMREDGYTMEQEPICGLPGAKPMVAIVDGKESVCLDYSMGQVTPLSALYTNRVRLVQSAAARVAKKLMETAAKEPPEWPIMAAGEVFNSIEEMERSPTQGVQEMAQMMRAAESFVEGKVWCQGCSRHVTGPCNQNPCSVKNLPWKSQTCWQYFGFDGPVDYEALHVIYGAKIAGIQPTDNHKLAGEIGLQYQNCLKDLANRLSR